MTPDRLAEIRQALTTRLITIVDATVALELLAEVDRLQQIVNDVWFIAEGGATDYIPAEKRQELLESIARRTRG